MKQNIKLHVLLLTAIMSFVEVTLTYEPESMSEYSRNEPTEVETPAEIKKQQDKDLARKQEQQAAISANLPKNATINNRTNGETARTAVPR